MTLLAAMTLLVLAAADAEPPTIQHFPVRRVDPGVALTVKARISDPSGVFDPGVSWRNAGGDTFKRVPMQAKGGSEFETVIPANAITAAAVEYFIEAFDENGNGPARFGNPQKPIRVAVATMAQMAGEPEPAPVPPPVAGTAPQGQPVAPQHVQPQQPAPPPPVKIIVRTTEVPPQGMEPTPVNPATPQEEEGMTPKAVGLAALVVGGGAVAAVLLVVVAAAAVGGIGALVYVANGSPGAPWNPPASQGSTSVPVRARGPSPAG